MSDCQWIVRTDILNDGYHIIKFHHKHVVSGHDSADSLLADMVIIETSTMSVFDRFLKTRPHSHDPLQLVTMSDKRDINQDGSRYDDMVAIPRSLARNFWNYLRNHGGAYEGNDLLYFHPTTLMTPSDLFERIYGVDTWENLILKKVFRFTAKSSYVSKNSILTSANPQQHLKEASNSVDLSRYDGNYALNA
jgi:hypothetical protein